MESHTLKSLQMFLSATSATMLFSSFAQASQDPEIPYAQVHLSDQIDCSRRSTAVFTLKNPSSESIFVSRFELSKGSTWQTSNRTEKETKSRLQLISAYEMTREHQIPVDILPVEIPAMSEVTFVLEIDSSLPDGYFRESIHVDWSYASSPEKTHREKPILYFRASNGCVYEENFNSYTSATEETISYNVEENGFVKTLVAAKEIMPSTVLLSGGISHPKSPLPVSKTGEPYVLNLPESGQTGQTTTLNLQYCPKITYKSDYSDNMGNTDGSRWWYARNDGTDLPAHGLEIQLWDRDTGGSGDENSTDDKIGSPIALDFPSGMDSTACVNFQWNPSEHGGEAYPDVYYTHEYTVRKPGGDFRVRLKSSSGTSYTRSSRDSAVQDLGKTATRAELTFYNTSSTSSTNLRFMASQSAQRFAETLGTYMNEDVTMYAENCVEGYGVEELSDNTASCAADQTTIFLEPNDFDRWGTPTHELGHTLMYQSGNWNPMPNELVIDDFLAGTSGNSYYTGLHTAGRAYLEGWAMFIQGVAWYPDMTSTTEAYDDSNWSLESSTSGETCEDNWRIPFRVAQAFWDMYDINPDGSDNCSRSMSSMLSLIENIDQILGEDIVNYADAAEDYSSSFGDCAEDALTQNNICN